VVVVDVGEADVPPNVDPLEEVLVGEVDAKPSHLPESVTARVCGEGERTEERAREITRKGRVANASISIPRKV